MISLEAWRGRIGSWTKRVRLSSNLPRKILKGIIWDNICGISTNLIACVIFVLLVVGGIEINPGPPRKDSNSSSEEDIQVPKSFDFGETSQGIYMYFLLL